jgi:nucleotide-binding universal stress UspA family protein
MIVVGVDGSDSSVEALRWAARQAVLGGDGVTAIAVWNWPTSFGWAPAYPSEFSPSGDADRVLREAIDAVRPEFPTLEIRTRVVEGRAAQVLVQLSRDADLLVVGSRGHGEFAGMLIGSVSEHCVTSAACPVVVVRPPKETPRDQ